MVREEKLISLLQGFKSVICYRVGLDIDPDYEQALLRVGKSFEHYVHRVVHEGHRPKDYRFSRKPLNVYIVLKTCELLSQNVAKSKPLQFHTGLGDVDIELRKSNPAYLQALIEEYPLVRFVILHAAYPFTREAGYLATVFKNVFFDVGEIFPQLSRDGQETTLRQAFELVPAGKLLYSSDGHMFPETYWLANKQFREALDRVSIHYEKRKRLETDFIEILVEYVVRGDISETAAIGIARDIMFNNANSIYQLGYEQQTGPAQPTGQRTLALPHPMSRNQSQTMAGTDTPRSLQAAPTPHAVAQRPAYPRVGDIKYVSVQWITYLGQLRARFVQNNGGIDAVLSKSFGISRGNIGTLQNDRITPAVNTTGQIYVKADPRTVKYVAQKDRIIKPQPILATVMSSWTDDHGVGIRECPRSNLQHYVNDLSQHFGIRLLVGFEIEVTFLERSPKSSDHKQETAYVPLSNNHAWGTFTTDDWKALPFLSEIGDALKEAGIPIEQFHSESGPGQYEFVLPPNEPVLAVDSLYQARQIIQLVAESAGYRATFHPNPLSCGNSSHVHISLNPPQNSSGWSLEAVEPHFWAGVLGHLDAICAFTLAEKESYDRVVADHWTGGEWIAWGTQNREAPLRKLDGGKMGSAVPRRLCEHVPRSRGHHCYWKYWLARKGRADA